MTQARLKMNGWVEGLTKGNIKDLVPAGYVDYSTRAAILNAAYFKGDWDRWDTEKLLHVYNYLFSASSSLMTLSWGTSMSSVTRSAWCSS